MTVGVFPADNDGCGNYRLRWPAEALLAEGHDVQVLEPGYKFGSPAAPVELPFDTIVIQRPMAPAWPLMIRHLRRAGHRVVVDVDDDLGALDRRHPMAGTDVRPLIEACAHADLVTVSTPRLAELYGVGHNVVIRNAVPAAYLSVRRFASERLTIGTTINVPSHPGDLDVMGRLPDVLRRTGARFVAIGNGDGYRKALGVEPDVIPWQAPDRYPEVLAQLDIGLAPLRLTAFNEAKSWLRPLEMAALGVLCLASPTPEYRALDTAVIVERPGQWVGLIKGFAASRTRRAELVERARLIAALHTIEGNTDLQAAAWTTRKKASL